MILIFLTLYLNFGYLLCLKINIDDITVIQDTSKTHISCEIRNTDFDNLKNNLKSVISVEDYYFYLSPDYKNEQLISKVTIKFFLKKPTNFLIISTILNNVKINTDSESIKIVKTCIVSGNYTIVITETDMVQLKIFNLNADFTHIEKMETYVQHIGYEDQCGFILASIYRANEKSLPMIYYDAENSNIHLCTRKDVRDNTLTSTNIVDCSDAYLKKTWYPKHLRTNHNSFTLSLNNGCSYKCLENIVIYGTENYNNAICDAMSKLILIFQNLFNIKVELLFHIFIIPQVPNKYLHRTMVISQDMNLNNPIHASIFGVILNFLNEISFEPFEEYIMNGIVDCIVGLLIDDMYPEKNFTQTMKLERFIQYTNKKYQILDDNLASYFINIQCLNTLDTLKSDSSRFFLKKILFSSKTINPTINFPVQVLSSLLKNDDLIFETTSIFLQRDSIREYTKIVIKFHNKRFFISTNSVDAIFVVKILIINQQDHTIFKTFTIFPNRIIELENNTKAVFLAGHEFPLLVEEYDTDAWETVKSILISTSKLIPSIERARLVRDIFYDLITDIDLDRKRIILEYLKTENNDIFPLLEGLKVLKKLYHTAMGRVSIMFEIKTLAHKILTKIDLKDTNLVQNSFVKTQWEYHCLFFELTRCVNTLSIEDIPKSYIPFSHSENVIFAQIIKDIPKVWDEYFDQMVSELDDEKKIRLADILFSTSSQERKAELLVKLLEWGSAYDSKFDNILNIISTNNGALLAVVNITISNHKVLENLNNVKTTKLLFGISEKLPFEFPQLFDQLFQILTKKFDNDVSTNPYKTLTYILKKEYHFVAQSTMNESERIKDSIAKLFD